MRIIKLNATNSTNSYLKGLYAKEILVDYTAVIADEQTQGRGQMGSVWVSQASKNLTFSVFKDLNGLRINYPFYISMVVALALIKTLEMFSIPRLSVKWPNDILSADKKICGVLIENVIKKQNITASIIGIGLNVNQTEFQNLPQASSLKNISGNLYDLNELAISIIDNIQIYFNLLEKGELDVLKETYESYLFRKKKPSTFMDIEGLMFSGFIKGVSCSGNLQVELEDHIIKEFDLKQIKLLY